MINIDRDDWGIDISVITIYIASLIRMLWTNFDGIIHSLTGVIALLLVSYRFWILVKRNYKKKNEKNIR